MRALSLLSCLLLAATIHAATTVTSITPATGPVTGGTEVVITGTGFSPLLAVRFGDTYAAVTEFVDETRIRAVTPAHYPGAVNVDLVSIGFLVRANDAFTFTGDAGDAFDRLLLPVFVEPTYAAFGAEFVSAPMVMNRGETPLAVDGLCAWRCDPTPGIVLQPNMPTNVVLRNGTPGRFIYTPKGRGDDFIANVRILDLSHRLPPNYGTQLPLVRAREFTENKIVLLDVPLVDGGLSRRTLRIYGTAEGFVRVRYFEIYGDPRLVSERIVALRAPSSVYDPAYAEIAVFAFVVGARIEIEPITAGLRIWAFATVTMNSSQQTTTFTPH